MKDTFEIKVYLPAGGGMMRDRGLPETFETKGDAETRAKELEDRGCDVVRTNYRPDA